VLPEGGRLQTIIVTELAARVGPGLAALIVRGQEQQRLRADLNPILTTLSLVSLAIFPFLSLPVTRRVFDLTVDAAFVEQMIEHSAKLFFHGAAAAPAGDDEHAT
jgi:hypothetical protein